MKPVAYAMFRDGQFYDAIHPDEQAKTVGEYDIPLYTHPAKTLTDEKIWELHQEYIDEVTCGHSMKTVGFIEFARAILRKAQE
jgi:hypothetical protein